VPKAEHVYLLVKSRLHGYGYETYANMTDFLKTNDWMQEDILYILVKNK